MRDTCRDTYRNLRRNARVIILASLLVALSACAPVIWGRAPQPLEPGQRETRVALGYPTPLTAVAPCTGMPPNPDCATGIVAPGYWPVATPVQLNLARGVAEGRTTNLTALLVPYASFPAPGLRYGATERLGAGPFALDYGAALFVSNAALDLGVSAATPLGAAELYGALRGLGTLSWLGEPGLAGAGTLTLGVQVPVSDAQRVFAELTLQGATFNGFGPREGVQPIGFWLVPALGVAF
ncbi:conserved hypothetical protein [Truepera radiovictrix DSM 17093]|uniref:Lipoprotein n=1 Tax=Truepera radiovictrix (strain DSM 17093 / CIP 108686 / LMG 22925 / RQ-24) TaxID=649638 RepID=D7CTR4_TRURR|nr:conserved hypothetical protein [Truepera radiovictrix DSM 17093]